MITFVIGGSGSGKSEYAESLVTVMPAERKRYYIATMQSFGEEGVRRVERHRKLRQGKGFETIECPMDLRESLKTIADPGKAVVLLECIPNLLANEMFGSSKGEENIVERISSDLAELCGRIADIVIVSDNVFEDGTEYGEETLRYMKYLAAVNAALVKLADQVTEVVAGIPVSIIPI